MTVVSPRQMSTHLVNELDWNNSQEHTLGGEKLLKNVKIYSKYATYIRFHHTHWNQLPQNLTQKEKLFANIIYLVDRVDALRAQMAMMFAYIVDAKSKFTSEHSIKVGSLSRCLAELFHLSQESCEKIEIAALLHDLGKLRVHDAILNKPNKLNADEKLIMNRHSFDTDIILRKIEGFKEITYLAAMHHEKLDGNGYPNNLSESDIPFEARIITVADIFQSLIQTRPYRDGLDTKNVLEILDEMTAKNEIDKTIVQKLKDNLSLCYECAVTHTK